MKEKVNEYLMNENWNRDLKITGKSASHSKLNLSLKLILMFSLIYFYNRDIVYFKIYIKAYL